MFKSNQLSKVFILLTFCVSLLFAVQSGKVAPKFKVRDLKGKVVKSEDIYANAPSVIFFWHSCGCCNISKEQNDVFNKVYETYKDKGINIVGIALDGKRKAAQVKKAVKVNKMVYTSVIDNNNKIKNMFKPTALPATYIISKGGKVLSVLNGFKPGDNDKISKILELVFKKL